MSQDEAVGYEPEDVAPPWSEQVLDWEMDFHRLLLGDELRMRAYGLAIAEAVRPGDVVLDLGTGTGVLARWALQAGAARAYGIERNPELLARACEAAAAEGYDGAFVPVGGLSFDVTLPERVDVVVSEVLGNLVDNEACGAILADARARFLRPDGRMVPHRVERYLVPVEALRAHATVARTDVERPFDAYYDVVLPRAGYLASPRCDRVFEAGADIGAYDSRLTFAVDRPGTFTGFKGWFVADLTDSVVLDISGDRTAGPARTSSDSWRHAYLPIDEPVDVETHDRITLTFSRTGRDGGPFAQSYRWAGEVRRGVEVRGRFAQAT